MQEILLSFFEMSISYRCYCCVDRKTHSVSYRGQAGVVAWLPNRHCERP
ncbi:hypothetical protein [Rickettsia felis]|nr:hypothetical protein [Rickettsia felis]